MRQPRLEVDDAHVLTLDEGCVPGGRRDLHRVTARRLELRHLRAELAEPRAGDGARHVDAEVDDPDAREHQRPV